MLVNYLREYQLAHGVDQAAVYDITMYVLGGSLLVSLACHLLVRPVADEHHMTDAQLESVRGPESHPLLLGAWSAVVVPLVWVRGRTRSGRDAGRRRSALGRGLKAPMPK